MKYTTIMATGLLVHMSLLAPDMLSTEDYANLAGEKVRILKQLGKQAECIRLASDHQALHACQKELVADKVNLPEKERTA